MAKQNDFSVAQGRLTSQLEDLQRELERLDSSADLFRMQRDRLANEVRQLEGRKAALTAELRQLELRAAELRTDVRVLDGLQAAHALVNRQERNARGMRDLVNEQPEKKEPAADEGSRFTKLEVD